MFFKKIARFVENLAYFAVFLLIAGICATLAQGMRAIHNDVTYAEKVFLGGKSGRVVSVLFSPDNDIKRALIGLIKATKGRIYATTFTLTDLDIAQAFIDKHNEGVPVEMITDKNCMNTQWSKIPILGKHRLCVYAFPKVLKEALAEGQRFQRDPLMHNKFIIFVDTIAHKTLVWTGSFNLSRAANEVNQENVVIIEDAHLAELYRKQFYVIAGRSSLVSGVPCVQGIDACAEKVSWFESMRRLVAV